MKTLTGIVLPNKQLTFGIIQAGQNTIGVIIVVKEKALKRTFFKAFSVV
ncbi:hypothetical protein [Chitinophaga costaii]|nr:hypothetical protein [Chitinophaga costaii]